MTETPIDTAHAAMEAAPEDDAARLRFYDRLADAELFLMLAEEARGTDVSPELFELGDARFVLAFDREDRLSAFAGRAVPYAALSGRGLAAMLAGQGIGLGLNLEVAPSSILLPAEALDWLRRTLDEGPSEASARPVRFAIPSGVPESLIDAIDAKLATAAGLAQSAYLAKVEYDTGTSGHILAFAGAAPGAEGALARAINEALVFSGLDAGALDVTFLPPDAPVFASLAKTALRFDLPAPDAPARIERIAPGSDPDKPPILR
jgi:hypothetical protein